jgi:hypothetical protein
MQALDAFSFGKGGGMAWSCVMLCLGVSWG